MKAITLKEPWASLVAVGAKKIETRSWQTKYRGFLAIHAGKNTKALDLAWNEPFFSALETQHTKHQDKIAIRYHLGCVIAICELVDCIEMTPEFLYQIHEIKNNPELDFGDFTVGRYAWILENVRHLDNPILATGKQGLWNWQGDINGT